MGEGDQKKKKKSQRKTIWLSHSCQKRCEKKTKSILNFKNLVKLGRYTSLASFTGLRCLFRKQTSKDHLQSSWPNRSVLKARNRRVPGTERAVMFLYAQEMLSCIRLLAPASGRSFKGILFFCKKNLINSPPILKLPPPAWQTTSATRDYIPENRNGARGAVTVNKGLIKS